MTRLPTINLFHKGDRTKMETVAVSTILMLPMGCLDYRQRRVLDLYYGEKKTLEEIGVEFGVTRARIRQIRCRALRKIYAHDKT